MMQYRTLNCNGKLISLDSPAVMGIVNITEDSFYTGSRVDENTVFARIEDMQREGVLLIDIGAMSSRPGAKIISPEEEWSRLSAVIPSFRKEFPDLLLSIDTLHSLTAQRALDVGADVINDISGGTYDSQMMATVGQYDVPFVIMHMRGLPGNMQQDPSYDHVVTAVFDFFVSQIAAAEKAGIVDLILDPGFGFGKSLTHNYELLHHLRAFEILRYPVLAGISRKGMIQKLLDVNTENALNGTTAVHMLALMNGARILRVHDVEEAVQCIKIWEKFNAPEQGISDFGSYIIS